MKELNINQDNIGMVFECSELSITRVFELRELLNLYGLQNDVILTHKLEASSIKEYIIQNNIILVKNDNILNTIDWENEIFQSLKNNPFLKNCYPPFD